MTRAHPGHDGEQEASQTGSWSLEPHEEGEETDPDLEAWLIAREADLEERRFALADQMAEEW